MPLQDEDKEEQPLADELEERVEDMLAGEAADAESVKEAFLSD